MNLQNLFQAVKDEPDLPTLFVVVAELEKQGYAVTVNDRLVNLRTVRDAEEKGQLTLIPSRGGFRITIEKNAEKQTFRVQILDFNAICLTDIDSSPVIYDERFKTGFFKSRGGN